MKNPKPLQTAWDYCHLPSDEKMTAKDYKRQQVDVPASFDFHGPLADKLAILASDLLWRTSLTEERRCYGHWIPYGRRQARPLLGQHYASVLREAEAAGLIERNQIYAPERFPKSVRLGKTHRDGRTKPYWLKRKRRLNSEIRVGKDDDVGLWMAERFARFSIDTDITKLNP